MEPSICVKFFFTTSPTMASVRLRFGGRWKFTPSTTSSTWMAEQLLPPLLPGEAAGKTVEDVLWGSGGQWQQAGGFCVYCQEENKTRQMPRLITRLLATWVLKFPAVLGTPMIQPAQDTQWFIVAVSKHYSYIYLELYQLGIRQAKHRSGRRRCRR